MSLTAFAAAVHFTKGYLSKVETGRIRPNRRLAEICDRVLDAGGALLALVPEHAAPQHTAGGLSGLPAGTRHFLGRDQELARLVALLRDPEAATVCVVDGMAGVGKTALAVAAAHEVEADFPDGHLFLDLRGHTPGLAKLAPADCLDRILRLLDVSGDLIPPDQDGRENLFRASLRDRRMLLVLDNVHSAGQIRPLLPAAGHSRVLITSRSRLVALDDATHVSVGGLTDADSTTLFCSIAAEEPDDNEQLTQKVVAYCGRLPLAVRIAAARLRHGGWTLTDFAARLADEAGRLDVLDDGERSVTAALAVSYEQLPPEQQRMLALLAVYPGTEIETWSAAALAGTCQDATDRILDRLHDSHLLVRRSARRIELHDLVRRFALTRALPAIEAADRHASVVRLLDQATRRVLLADQLIEPDRYRPELSLPESPVPDFEDEPAALEWLRDQWPALAALVDLAEAEGLTGRCWQLAFLLRAFFYRDKVIEPWLGTHATALRAVRAAGDREAAAMTVANLGIGLLEQGNLAGAESCHRQALALFTELGNEIGMIDARSNAAWVRLYRGEPETALAELLAVSAEYRRVGRHRNEMIALRGVALAATVLDQFEQARLHAERSALLSRTSLDEVMALNCLAWIDFRAGEQNSAGHRYATAVTIGESHRLVHELSRAKTGLGNLAATRGDTATAARRWAEADALPVTLNPVLVGEARARTDLESGTG